MSREHFFGCSAFAVALALSVAVRAGAQTPPLAPDIPKKFEQPAAQLDYIKRTAMIPMRDGVKLYAVIVIPKNAKGAPIILTRTPYHASKRAERNISTHMNATLPQGDEVFVGEGYIRVFEDVRGKYDSEGEYVMTQAAARSAQFEQGRSFDRCVRHDRMAGEERAGIQRQGRDDRLLVRRLHGPDGAHQSAPGSQGRRGHEPDGRRLEGR